MHEDAVLLCNAHEERYVMVGTTAMRSHSRLFQRDDDTDPLTCYDGLRERRRQFRRTPPTV